MFAVVLLLLFSSPSIVKFICLTSLEQSKLTGGGVGRGDIIGCAIIHRVLDFSASFRMIHSGVDSTVEDGLGNCTTTGSVLLVVQDDCKLEL